MRDARARVDLPRLPCVCTVYEPVHIYICAIFASLYWSACVHVYVRQQQQHRGRVSCDACIARPRRLQCPESCERQTAVCSSSSSSNLRAARRRANKCSREYLTETCLSLPPSHSLFVRDDCLRWRRKKNPYLLRSPYNNAQYTYKRCTCRVLA